MNILSLVITLGVSIPIILLFLAVNRGIPRKRKIAYFVLLYVITVFTQILAAAVLRLGDPAQLLIVAICAASLYAFVLSLVIHRPDRQKKRSGAASGPGSGEAPPSAGGSAPTGKAMDPAIKVAIIVAIIQGVFSVAVAIVTELIRSSL